MKKRLLLIFGCLFAGVVLGLAIHGGIVGAQRNAAHQAMLANYQLNTRIADIGRELGIPEINLKRLQVHFGDVNTICATSSALTTGCYQPNTKVIIISPKAEYDDRSVAHEYLHWVYTTQTSQLEKDSLVKLLMTYYYQHKAYYDVRLKPYYDAGYTPASAEFVNELHSIVGAEATPIPPELLAHYHRWLPGRASLTLDNIQP